MIQKITSPLLTKKSYLYNKLTNNYLIDMSILRVKYNVKVLK